MSAPKPELTPELRAVIQRHDIGSLCDCPSYDDCLFAAVREVVEIVARKDSTRAANWLGHNYQLSEAILKDWGLK